MLRQSGKDSSTITMNIAVRFSWSAEVDALKRLQAETPVKESTGQAPVNKNTGQAPVNKNTGRAAADPPSSDFGATGLDAFGISSFPAARQSVSFLRAGLYDLLINV
jgi:hypothetical protein